MIFRKTEQTVPVKTPVAQNNMPGRREPELSMTPKTATPPAPVVQAPVSPIAVAQARRTSQTPANSYGGRNPDQVRKLTVGRDISLNGEITTCDHLVVEGTVRATIKDGLMLEIAESGAFAGMVDIESADIAGAFDGELTVKGKLVLRPSAVVTGTIRYGRLQVDTGATLNGMISVLPAAAQSAQSLSPLAAINDEPGFLKVAG